MNEIKESEFILNPDGSIYHLHLRSTYRNYHHRGRSRKSEPGKCALRFQRAPSAKPRVCYARRYVEIDEISTGVGTDNMDIGFVEYDALVNVDFETRRVKQSLTSLDILRLGTSGSVSADVDVDSVMITD